METLIDYTSKVYYKLLEILIDNGRCLKTSPYLSLHSLSETQRRLLWKSYLNKLTPVEERYKADLRKYFNKQRKLILSKLPDQTEIAGRYIDVSEIDNWVFKLDEENEKMKPLNTKYIRESIETAGITPEELKKDFNAEDDEIEEYIKAKEQTTSNNINVYTLTLLTSAYLTAIENQESASMIATRVNGIADFNETYRAARIARTECSSAMNYGTLQAARQSGKIWGNQWIAEQDDRTRDNHRILGEQQARVKLGDRFPIVNLEYPGDPTGSIEETVNCRCVLLPLRFDAIGTENE